MLRKARYVTFISHFAKELPTPRTELNYRTPFELLIAVILSAQCTDKRVNQVTPALFQVFPTAAHMAASDQATILSYVKSISYPHSKTGYLLATSRKLVEHFNSKLPRTTKELQTLPGVGRKTAHILLAELYGEPTLAVDTHVFRVAHRLGMVSEGARTPLAVEKEIVRYTPKHEIPRMHHWMLLHGRYRCTARAPKCGDCPFTNFCSYYRDVMQSNT